MVKRNAPAKNGSRRVPQIDKDIKRWEMQIPKPENVPMEMDHGLERYIEQCAIVSGLKMQWYPHSDRCRSQRGEYSMVFNVHAIPSMLDCIIAKSSRGIAIFA
ncbi:hypothetical protein IEO21_03664 [Rhodonia placenta]|uniref:Uncharacterized protein n=1 Tax=Rhodonia placenta TaxID=104341 RepID=A0A8H7U3C1_9APHY|nr:hypothetical protein IEO21_03664 [Postia placenta]